MHPFKSHLDAIFTSQNEYKTPVYQRHYEWGCINWERLWRTLMKGYIDTNSPEYAYFFGTIILHQKSHPIDMNKSIFEIIDGQQRIVTIALFLAAMRTYTTDDKIQDRLHSLLLKDPTKFRKNINNSRIEISYKDHRDFNYLVNGVTDLSDKSKSLYQCYKFFVDKFANIPNPLNLNSFLDILLKKFFTIAIKLDPSEKAGPTFETVNAYSVPLETLDHIRTFIFTWIDPARIESLYTNRWTVIEKEFESSNKLLQFISHVLEMKLGMQIAGSYKEYDMLSAYLRDDDEKIQESNIEQFLEDLMKNLPYYLIIENPKYGNDKINISEDIRYQLLKLKFLSITSYYPFLLLCFNRYYDPINKRITDEKSLKKIFSYIETIFIRRYICLPKNLPITDWFVDLCKLSNEDSTILLIDIMEENSQDILPKDDVFRVKIGREPIYCSNYISICRLILYVLEDYLSHNTPGYSADKKKLTIEHILPQNITNSEYWKNVLGNDWMTNHQSWVHTLGNLALIAREPNVWASNDSFPNKCSIYQNCITALLNPVKNKNEWSLTDIQERAEILTDVSLQVWKYYAKTSNKEEIAIVPDRRSISNTFSNIPIKHLKTSDVKLLTFWIKDEMNVLREVRKPNWKKIHTITIEKLYAINPRKFIECMNKEVLKGRFSLEPNQLGKKEIKINGVNLYYKPESPSPKIYKQCTELKKEMGLTDDEWFLVVEYQGEKYRMI